MVNERTSDSDNNHPILKPHPSTVGNSFVKQYYHLLGQNPETLHRFYKDESQYTHGAGSVQETPVTGQKNINDKILSMGFSGARVDLESGSVDCQGSSDDGVIVMVSGTITLLQSHPRPFVQTFFLAVQPNGYFVLNDTLRYLDVAQLHIPQPPIPAVAPPAPSPAPILSPKRNAMHPIKSSSPCREARSPDSSSKSSVSVEETTIKTKSQKHTRENLVEREKPAVDDITPVKVDDVAATVAAHPAENSDWASFLFKAKGSPVPRSSTTAKQTPALSISGTDDLNGVCDDAKEIQSPRSLYVGEMPNQTKESDLRDIFKQFGAIANISLYSNRNFAFIDYEEPESVVNALANGRTFTLFDQLLHVEARHSDRKSELGSGGRGRGISRGGRAHGDRSNFNRSDKQGRDKESRTREGGGDRREKGGRRGGRPDFQGRSRGA